MLESVLLPTISFALCDRKRHNIRAVLLAVVIFNTCSFLQYILVFLHPEYYFITLVFFVMFLIPYLYRYVVESLHPISDFYSTDGCFLAYKRPNSITGSLCALATAPYGHCSLIVGDREFLYKNGVVIEREVELTNKLTFRKINKLSIEEARELLGVKWSLKNNCFTTFSCFKSI